MQNIQRAIPQVAQSSNPDATALPLSEDDLDSGFFIPPEVRDERALDWEMKFIGRLLAL